MSELHFPAVPGDLSKGSFEDSQNIKLIDASNILSQHNNALVAICGGFFIYLLVPKGAKKYFCNAYPRRFLRTGKNRLVATKAKATHIRTILPTVKNALIDTRRAWEADKKKLVASPSEANSRGTLNFEYEKECFMSPQLLYQANACTRKGNNRLCGSPDACSSMHSSPSRLFSNDRQMSSYGSTNQRGVRLFVSPEERREEHVSTKSTQLREAACEVDNSKKLLVLISKGCLDEAKEYQQIEALALLRARRVPFEVVDGMDPMQRSRRQELCRISGVRANYPQFFFLCGDGSITFLGDYRVLLKIHHAEGLPKSYRDAHPDTQTWNAVFADTSHIFSV